MIPLICAPPAVDRFASRLLADTDCQAMGMVERGYAALAQPGGTVSIALTGLMVIAVAFFGYRLLLGRGIVLADAVNLVLKLGLVLMLVTSWGSWQALAYEGVARAPGLIASEMLIGIGAPPPIESLENTLDKLTEAAVGYRTRAGIASPLVGGPAAAAATLNVSAVLITLSTVGILVATRVVLAILLAIAPAMAGFILFDGTRGMALGWLGAIAALAIAPAFALLVAAVEFALLTPILTRLLSEQAAGTFEVVSVMPVGLVTVVFVITLIFAIRAASQISRGLLVPRRGAPAGAAINATAASSAAARGAYDQLIPAASAPRLARTLESISRREQPGGAAPAPRTTFAVRASSAARDSGTARGVAAPGVTNLMSYNQRSHQLRSVTRRSRASARRDA